MGQKAWGKAQRVKGVGLRLKAEGSRVGCSRSGLNLAVEIERISIR